MVNKEPSMNRPIELEWHQLELRYTDIRIHTDIAIRCLMTSIHTHGLLTPIVVVQSDQTSTPQQSWIVIDGYLRIAALKALHHDCVPALHSSCDVKDALITLYRLNASRTWEAYEEAQLIQTLVTEHALSQTEVAKQLGKSKTWVTHRLQLLHDLPEFIQTAIRQGVLSTWTAHRLILPFARANSDHAKKLVDYLTVHAHPSRDIQAYYLHYLRANRHVRQKMVDYPQHFFNAHSFQTRSSTLSLDKLAPESVWEETLATCMSHLQTLHTIVPAVFFPQQKQEEQAILMESFISLMNQINQLHHLIRSRINAQSTHETNSATAASNRQEHSGN
jgi:ParB/RepB/Spo0J family partition protein